MDKKITSGDQKAQALRKLGELRQSKEQQVEKRPDDKSLTDIKSRIGELRTQIKASNLNALRRQVAQKADFAKDTKGISEISSSDVKYVEAPKFGKLEARDRMKELIRSNTSEEREKFQMVWKELREFMTSNPEIRSYLAKNPEEVAKILKRVQEINQV